MSFAVIIELATIVAFVVVILGGRQTREYGWKIVCSLLAVTALAQCASMAIIVRGRVELRRRSLANPSRHTFSIMTSDSFLVGSWILRGYSVPSAGLLRCSPALALEPLRTPYQMKAAMSLFLVSNSFNRPERNLYSCSRV